MSQHATITELKNWLTKQIIGQERLIDRLLIALLADGHLLVEGAPGLAKTKAIKDLSRGIEGDFHRIQFTPDLLPSDITGTEVFRPEDGSFRFQQGPIFHNLVLADEINRAPAKVQSALLEAMGEHQVSVGRESFTLAPLFLVMATQNPIEQEGTYPLPEAQLDRFLMHVTITYPSIEAERKILHLVRNEAANKLPEPPPQVRQEKVFAARQEVLEMHMAPEVEEYIIQLIMATRNPLVYGQDARAPTPGFRARISSAPTMCRRSCSTFSAIAFCSLSKPKPAASHRTRFWKQFSNACHPPDGAGPI